MSVSKNKQGTRKYRGKRDFQHTPEPSGSRKDRKGGKPIFVIQKHDASRLHYDFRLEVDGVLKSWAVPKGPSTDPREKRLARQVEDHPLDYAEFEGVIPQDEYGGGTVLVWDKGTYRNTTTEEEAGEVDMKHGLKNGHVSFDLKGGKLRGGYALTRTGKDRSKRWLLVKMKDHHADARRNPLSTQPKSALSRRTMHQVAREAKEKEEKP